MEWIFIFVAIFVIIIIAIAIVASIYNNLITRRNKVKNSWAHIDAQLQRRFDLMPRLVEIVKGCIAHEERILENVKTTFNDYINAQTNERKLAVNAELTAYLKSLYVIAGRYPELKSNQNFLQLQEALTEIEEDITYARQFYNDAVTIYNNELMRFPGNIIASMFNFKEEVLFDAVKGAEVSQKLNFKLNNHTVCPVCGASVSESDINCEYCNCSLT